jgi:LacI family transcriptional regulator
MATIVTIAAATGLSIGAVSQILNQKGRFADETRARVLAQARKLGYRPNVGARATRRQRFDAVGLLTISTSWKGNLQPQLLSGVERRLGAAGRRLLLESVDDSELQALGSGPRMLAQRACDGLILNYHLSPPDEVLAAIQQANLPVVWMNLLLLDQACVCPDDGAAVRSGVQALVERGRRRLALLDYHHPEHLVEGAHHSVGERRRAFIGACTDLSVTPRVIAPTERLDWNQAAAFTRSWLDGEAAPDAVIAYSEREALLYLQAMWLRGRQIPRDASLLVFSSQGSLAGMPVSTLRLPYEELGRRAAELVLAAVEGTGSARGPVRVPYELMDGGTH